ncbi:MAG: MBL fold metallo-hydrolase [Pseudomonadota bacterium]
MRVKFWGTRGSIPVPGKETIQYGGNTTCLEVTLQSGKIVVIDAGTGIRALGDKLAAENERVEVHLLMTHIHWDHVLGFPFFGPIYNPSSKICIDGYHTCMKGLRHTFDNKMGDGFFPVKFDDLKADITYLEELDKGILEIDGTVIDCIPLQHPQGGFGYRLREGEKTLVFITDNELRDDAWAGRSQKDFIEFCMGADVLIHDAQYTPQEIDDRRDWGHSDFPSTFELAYRAGVKKLILFHHDPTRTDPQVTAICELCEGLAKEKRSPIIIEAAKEGTEFEL